MTPRDATAVSFEQLSWVAACLALTLLAGINTLPVWVTVTVVAVGAMRLLLAARGRDAPPRAVRLSIALLAIGLLFLEFRTFNGLTPGTALLSLIAGLKLLETRTRRDIHVVIMIIYFLSLSTLLKGESIGLLVYLVAVCWLSTAGLLRSTDLGGASRSSSVRRAGRLIAQALPLAAALWLFFPRFGGPLWQMPESGAASSGLSDSMSPGDITDLALSEEVAFRARFSGATPPPGERYWRGPVLHEFDGETWRRGELGGGLPAKLRVEGPGYHYTVSLEASPHDWLYLLDWPAQWDAPGAFLNADYMLIQPRGLAQPVDIVATSFPHVQSVDAITPALRRSDLRLPPQRDPRSLRLAAELHAAHPEPLAYIRAVLDLFHDEPFFYTLNPPRLSGDTIDGFLFDSRRGFCGHYASAFAVLMRAAGIPTHVVTGYQGGTFNRFAGYWILRQSDAHAWDEVWLDGRGWVRFDPTSAIAAERRERGAGELFQAGAPTLSPWQARAPWLADLRLRLDALRVFWRNNVILFNQRSQLELLALLHVPDPDGQKLALMLAICLIAAMAWLTWQVRRDLVRRPATGVERAFERLCRRLAAVGVARRPFEGAEAFAVRVAAQRPDLASRVLALCTQYSQLRYARGTPPDAASGFVAAVRAFRPGRQPR